MTVDTIAMMSSSNSSTNKKRPLHQRTMRRRISFSPDVVVIPSLHLNDYTDDEVDMCWYHPDEQADFRNEARSTISIMEERGAMIESNDPNHGELCTRGLEGLTAAGASIKKQNRVFALNTVLQQQEIQFQAGIRDEKQLAKLYSLCSFSCNIQANLIGLSDSNIAKSEAPKKQESAIAPRFPPRRIRGGIQLVRSA